MTMIQPQPGDTSPEELFAQLGVSEADVAKERAAFVDLFHRAQTSAATMAQALRLVRSFTADIIEDEADQFAWAINEALDIAARQQAALEHFEAAVHYWLIAKE